jgi:Cu/Zn superoxide dismutase
VGLRMPIVTRKVSEYPRREIVYRTKRFAGVVFGAILLVSLVLAGGAVAQETDSVTLQLTPSRDSGVSGTATLTDVEGGVKVELDMRGLPEAGVEHINHFHGGGTCADDRAGRTAPVTIPLKPVVAKEDGTGSATTTIKDVTLDELFGGDQKRFILLHAKTIEGQGVPPGISCVDLPQRSGNNGFEPLPASGGFPPALLLATPLALILAGTAGLVAIRRRIA